MAENTTPEENQTEIKIMRKKPPRRAVHSYKTGNRPTFNEYQLRRRAVHSYKTGGRPTFNEYQFRYDRPQSLLESRNILQRLSEKPLSFVGQSEYRITPIFREHQIRYKQPQSLLESLHVCQRLADEVKNIRQPQWCFRQPERQITPTFQHQPRWSVSQSGLWITPNFRTHQAHRISDLNLLDPREPRKSMMPSILPLQEYAPWARMNAGTAFSLVSVCA
ncbi:uncharacterized protein LOC121504262 isoform X1 [Cheilinus undulatus]|uniref:uncharacterized protein LOC121504262 isoform X1 n=1 Tax=Cheilinus undulatus TaxID=241271 RepID=UPI001BD22E92|nr:uncharacterized protein LOC121504262 isoform X1 [Cheilinus undulatus]